MIELNLQYFGGRGSAGARGGGGAYNKAIDALETPKDSMVFQDSKVSPIKYDGDKLMKVAFGNWDETSKGTLEDVPVSSLRTVQPYVQANKLRNMPKDISTEDVHVLQIGNNYYIKDGNHRVSSKILRGKKTVRVRVYKEN